MTIYPSDGAPITDDPTAFVQAYIDHRRAREEAILQAIDEGLDRIPQMVSKIYRDVDRRLHPAACHSVLAHLMHMASEGRVRTAGGEPASIVASYLPAREAASALA